VKPTPLRKSQGKATRESDSALIKHPIAGEVFFFTFFL
jgi:hypothetical protein